MVLKVREQQILHAALLKGMTPAKELALLSGHPEHAVRNDLLSLQKRGIITPYTLINQFKLGWLKIGVHFSFNTGKPEKIGKAIEGLSGYGPVTSVVELFGRYQFFMSLNLRSLFEAEEFLQQLRQDLPECDIRHDLSLRRSLTLFKRKYLRPEAKDHSHLTYSFEAIPVEIDQASIKVLNAINANGGFPNALAISETIGMPHSTVHTKIKGLEKKGVIVGYSYSLDPLKIGQAPYDLLIKTSVRNNAFREKFFQYCAEHSYIVGLTDCIGHWNYELRIEVPSPSVANEISQQILDRFRADILDMEAAAICREIKYMRTAAIPVKD